MSEILRDVLYRTALGAGSFKHFSSGFVILVIKTTLMILCSQHSPSLIAHFVVFFASGYFPQGKHVFFIVCWFSLPLLSRKRLIKNYVVYCNFPGSVVSNSSRAPTQYSFSFTSFLNTCSWVVEAMSPLLRIVFK